MYAALTWSARGSLGIAMVIAAVNGEHWETAPIIALGVAIWLQSGLPSPTRIRLGLGLATLSAVLAGAFLADLARPQVGAPAIATAISVLLLSGAVMVRNVRRPWAGPVWTAALVCAAIPPFTAVVAQVFQAAQVTAFALVTAMETMTAFSLLLLVAGAALASPDRPPVAMVLAGADGWPLARLAGIFAGLPLLLGLCHLTFVNLGLAEDAALFAAVLVSSLAAGAAAVQSIRWERRLISDRAAVDLRYRFLAENAADVVAHLRGDQVQWISPSAEAAFGWPAEQWLGRPFAPRIHPEDLGTVAAALALNAQGRTAEARFRVATADGGYRWVEGHGKPFNDGESGDDGVVVALRTIDAQIEVELELEGALDYAIGVAGERSDYVSTVSHEIRAPLHSIGGFAELLENQLRAEGREEATQWSRRIRAEAERLARLIEELLDLSRLDSGRVKVASEAFSLRKAADEVIQISSIKARDKGLRLSVSVDPTIADWRLGDSDRLHQVLLNLLSNATKFTGEGRIDLDISPVATTTTTDFVRFAVADTGPGIPAGELDRILKPFEQVRSADADLGSGLGLAISDRLVKAMGGDGLTVTSAEGQGSTFRFSLPLPETSPRVPVTHVDTGRGATSERKNILVVDDNPTNQLLVEAQLKKLGYGSAVAANGAEALDRLKSEEFDLVLMDCNMPVMNGYEATRRLRAQERGTGHRLPILALTASTLGSNRDACERAGMDGFLGKPLLLSELSREISRFIGAGEAPSTEPAESDVGSPVRQTPAVPVLDQARIDRLMDELGPCSLEKVNSTFVAEMPRRLAELFRAADEGDADAVRRGAHAIRSPSSMLGATALAAELRTVEEADDPILSMSKARLGELVGASIDSLQARFGHSEDGGKTP